MKMWYLEIREISSIKFEFPNFFPDSFHRWRRKVWGMSQVVQYRKELTAARRDKWRHKAHLMTSYNNGSTKSTRITPPITSISSSIFYCKNVNHSNKRKNNTSFNSLFCGLIWHAYNFAQLLNFHLGLNPAIFSNCTKVQVQWTLVITSTDIKKKSL